MAYQNRWSNFNNNALYDKYKQTQPAPMSAPTQSQQQGGQNYNDIGKNIGKAWKDSLAKRNDGMYQGNIVGGTGNDAQNYAQMQNAMQNSNVANLSQEIGAEQLFGDMANPYAETVAGQMGNNMATTIGADALANAGENAIVNAATNTAVDAGTTAAIEGATEGATAAASSGVGSALGSVLGPLGIAYGVYSLGDTLDWW